MLYLDFHRWRRSLWNSLRQTGTLGWGTNIRQIRHAVEEIEVSKEVGKEGNVDIMLNFDLILMFNQSLTFSSKHLVKTVITNI